MGERWGWFAVAMGMVSATVAASGGGAELLASLGASVGGAPLPLAVEPEARSMERVADVAILLAGVGGLMALGALLRRSIAGFRPVVMTSVVLGVGFLTVLDIQPFQVERVELDAAGVSVSTYNGAPARMEWAAVAEIYLQEGHPWPLFTDDRRLVLVDKLGSEVALPLWIPRRAEVLGVVVDRLPPGVTVRAD